MAALHIRDVEPALLAALRASAELHHRSVQGEVKAILESVLAHPDPGSRQALKIHLAEVGAPVTYRREDLYGDDGR